MAAIFDPGLEKRIADCGIVAVLIIDREDDAVPLAEALLRGGVSAMELTLRTPAAIPALKKICAGVPEMLAGVGTILTPDQAKEAQDAGAAFGVSPGTNPKVLEAAAQRGFSFAPGILTPSDIEAAVGHGCRMLKFFPAEPSGGLAYLKAMSAPYVHLGLRFIPLGGLNAGNMASYLSDPLISALGGSWLAPRDAIKEGRWDAIASLASEAVQIIQSVRKK